MTFVASKKILKLINMSNEFKKLPSQILRVTDTYVAFCIDEVCAYIIQELRDGREIKKEKKNNAPAKKEVKKSSSVDDYLAHMQSLEFS